MDVELLFHMTLKPFNWIIKESGLPWLPLDISLPYEEMLEEAKALKSRFVSHRSNDAPGGYTHRGWKSLCLHGISDEHTNHYESYGYKSNEETPYKWTESSELCPITKNWLLNSFPMKEYYRVRFMLLEPNGFIAPHTDGTNNSLSPINIALNHPENCIFKMKNYGVVPMKPGVVMLLNVTNIHAYINNSTIDRYHIIIHGSSNIENYRNLVEKSYDKLY